MKIPLQFVFLVGIALFSAKSFSQNTDIKDDGAPKVDTSVQMQAATSVPEAPIALAASVPDNFIPARTAVKFFLSTMVSTKTAVPGEQFQLTVAEDLQINNKTLIVKGTPATGEVIHAQKARGFGKAGELLVTIRFIDNNGQKIKMRSFQPYQGNNKSGEVMAMSMVPVVGLFSGFMQGGDIEMPAQTLVTALIATDTTIVPVNAPASITANHPETPQDDVNKITNGESK